MTADRPTPRARPRPAPDAGADPADLGMPAERVPVLQPAPATSDIPVAQMLRMTAGPTKQLGQRISVGVWELLIATSKQTGVRPRALLEYAVVQAFATEEGRREWQEK